MCVQNFMKLSAAIHELSPVNESGLRSRISLERIKQSTSGKRCYQIALCFTFDENNLVNFNPLTKNDLE